MEIVLCLLLGYGLGCLNPAALLGKLKHIDLKTVGTRNLGAMNALLVLGKLSGAIVMVVDIAKSWLACKIAKALFPLLTAAGLAAGLGAILGHIFPFYLRFSGGKGLAPFAGMVLAYDPWIFLLLLVISVTAVLIVNYSYAMPMTGGFLFPVLAWLKSKSIVAFAISALSGLLVIIKHWSNIGKAKRGEDNKVREYIRDNLLPKRKQKV